MAKVEKLHLTQEQMAEIFEEWKLRYDMDPEGFMDFEAFRARPPKNYGEGAAMYFFWLQNEMLEGH